MKIKNKKLKAGVLGMLLASGSAYSATEVKDYIDMSLEDLLNVKITTASRSAQSIKDLPITTYVITRDEILNNNYRTIGDALSASPSKAVYKVPGQFGSIGTLHGLSEILYSKILIDGIPFSPTVNGFENNGDSINMKNVDRIEIVYGPASALYGADTVTGIINIISYKPEKTYARGDITYGEKNYINGNAFFGSNFLEDKNKIKFNMYANYNKFDDIKVKDGFEKVWTRDNQFDIAASKDISLLLALAGQAIPPFGLGKIPGKAYSFGVNVNFRDFTFLFDSFADSYRTLYGWSTHTTDYNDTSQGSHETRNRFALKHEFNSESGDLTINSNLSYLKFKLDPTKYTNFFLNYKNDYKLYNFGKSDELMLDEVLNYNFNKEFKLTTGFAYTYSGIMPTSYTFTRPVDETQYNIFGKSTTYRDPALGEFGLNPKLIQNEGAFAQLSYNTDKINAVAGGRVDHNTAFGTSFNPRIAAQYNFETKTSVRASYATSFKAPSPSFTSYSVAADVSVLTGYPAPNDKLNGIYYLGVPADNLKPEKFKAYELGVRQQINSNLTGELIYTYGKLTNNFRGVPVDLDTNKYKNSITGVQQKVITYANSPNSYSEAHNIDLLLRAQNIVESIKLGTDLFLTASSQTFILNNGEKVRYAPSMTNFVGKLNVHANPLPKMYIGLLNNYYGKVTPNFNTDTKTQDSDFNPACIVSNLNINYELIKDFKLNLNVENLFNRHNYAASPFIFSLGGTPMANRTIYGGVNYTF